MQNFRSIFSKKNLKPIIDFGLMPLGNGFVKSKINNLYKFKLKIGFNNKLSLVQLYHYPSPSKMFNKDYAFLSSTSKNMQKHFKKCADTLKKKFKNKKISVMEVGCNDGILLKNFKNNDHLGIEPSKNVCKIARHKGLNVLNNFFNRDLIKNGKVKKKFDIICGANVFCHIPDLHEMFSSLSLFLKQGGIISIEEPYLGDMIEKTSYDQIYDEHIFIFSIISINKIASFFNLEVFDAEPQKTHGGSMRYYLSQKKQKKITKRLNNLVLKEKKQGLDDFKKLKRFEKNCIKSKKKLFSKINKLSKKYEIYGYGATSKSTTILNFCKIDNTKIKAIFDNSFTKISKYTPVSNIPIISYDDNFGNIKPKICVLFAWNHFKEICDKEKNILNSGMKFISHIEKKFFNKYKNYFL